MTNNLLDSKLLMGGTVKGSNNETSFVRQLCPFNRTCNRDGIYIKAVLEGRESQVEVFRLVQGIEGPSTLSEPAIFQDHANCMAAHPSLFRRGGDGWWTIPETGDNLRRCK